MRTTQIIFALAASLLTQSVVAQGLPGSVGGLQTQLDALAARIQILEVSAPDSSVEGRTYCHVVDFLIMEGLNPAGTERLARLVIRRTATFSGGFFSAVLESSVLHIQNDAGTVFQPITPAVSPLTGTYTQDGNRLNMELDINISATWYVSKDGSVIYGTLINQPPSEDIGVDTLTSGVTRNWTLIENDDCAAEIIQ